MLTRTRRSFLRSRQVSEVRQIIKVLAAGVAGVTLIPAFVGFILLVLSAVVGGQAVDLSMGLTAFGWILISTPLFTWVGYFIAIPCAIVALRIGYAGWGVALMAGAFLAIPTNLLFYTFESRDGVTLLAQLTFIPMTTFFAMCFWLGAFVFHQSIFQRDVTPSK